MTQTLLICGASRGIGREMVRQAAARGDRVIATVRGDVEALQDDADLVLRCDITDEAALTAVAAAAGEIDVLVVNAGVYRGRGGIDADDMGADAWSEVLMTNVAGPFLAVRALLGNLRAPGGKIAIISSVMASSTQAPGGSYIYRASKAGATNVARNLAVELKPRCIAVGAYHPGWVRTDMGGSSASVGVEDSVAGLLNRFDALDMGSSGVFEDFQGQTIPF